MIKLSIIIPVYNCEKTVALAIDSILMQVVNFSYEIIIVDDASSDNSYSIIQKYAEQYPFIKVIKHEKNQGNAISFYDALSASNGDYFCVLDGDDYYTVKYKLQKQVDFLDSDTANEYTAVAHHCLRVGTDGVIHSGNIAVYEEKTHTYKEFLSQKFYYHTSTYMYRNIFRDNVPEVFKQEIFRGDNPRTFMHLNATKGKIKVLNFYGSIYLYSDTGIWSKMSYNDQISRNIRMLQAFSDYCSEKWEKDILSEVIKGNSAKCKNETPKQNYLTKDLFLSKLKAVAGSYCFAARDCRDKTLYKSLPIDSLCETVGFAAAAQKNIIPSNPVKSDKNNILIAIPDIDFKYKTAASLISNIVKNNSEKKIFILLTNIDDINSLKDNAKEFLNSLGVELLFGSSKTDNKLDILIQKIIRVSPSKIYHFLYRTNSFSAALAQSLYGTNVFMMPYKRGFCIGMNISSFDFYMTGYKKISKMLSCIYDSKVLFIDKDGNISTAVKPDKISTNDFKICETNRKMIHPYRIFLLKVKNFYGKIYNKILSEKQI